MGYPEKKRPVKYVTGFVPVDHDQIEECLFGLSEDGEPITCSVQRTHYRVAVYTEELRIKAYGQRGREGFSYGKSVCILPSAHFYRPRNTEEERFGYRDEED